MSLNETMQEIHLNEITEFCLTITVYINNVLGYISPGSMAKEQ